MDNVEKIMAILFLSGIAIGLALYSIFVPVSYGDQRAMFHLCEKPLLRSQECKLIAVVDEDGK